MIFLKLIMLFGLAALAIPVIIHLLNRSKARQLDWGAMRFLLASLVARRRRLILEELVLLVLRCLAVALIALAMARPFLPSSSVLPSAFALPALLLAAGLAAAVAAFWDRKTVRLNLIRAIAVLLALAAAAVLVERRLQGKLWVNRADSRDTVILIDGSSFMRIKVDGKTNFERAVEESKTIVDMNRPGDATALMVAGPVPRPILRTPTTDRKEIAKAFEDPALKPVGGSMGVLEALNAAAGSLAEGHNPMKRVVLITGGQEAGWDVQSEGRWKFIAEAFKRLPSLPQFICRKLALPNAFRNAAAAGITFTRPVIGTDRPVKIDARVANSGNQPIQPTGVELLVDGNRAAREDFVKEITPGAAETVRFEHRFDKPGRHVVTVRVLGEDDLPADNANDRVVDVLDKLPVLLVDGAPAERFFQGAAAFTRVALTPAEDAAPAITPAAPGSTAAQSFLVEPKVVKARELETFGELNKYRVVILANVPRLTRAVIDRLEEFVREGGGLLIAPGRHAEADFYNRWRTPAGRLLAPATMGERVTPKDNPPHFELKTFTHPALQLIADTSQSDAGLALVRTLWTLTVDTTDPDVRVCGQLENGAPLLVERKIGKGYVLMTAIAMDRRDSNLPSLKCFLPLIHELVYYLAAPMAPDPNVRPGVEYVLELTAAMPGLNVKTNMFASYRAAQNPPVEVILPSTNRVTAVAKPVGDRLAIRFAATLEPGLYRVVIPAALAARVDATNAAAGVEMPFTVVSHGQDAAMRPLTESDVSQVKNRVGMFVAKSREDMITAFGGNVPGREIWKYLALCALLLLVAETAFTRWIAVQRRFNSAEVVKLRSPIEAIIEIRTDIRKLFAGRGGAGRIR